MRCVAGSAAAARAAYTPSMSGPWQPSKRCRTRTRSGGATQVVSPSAGRSPRRSRARKTVRGADRGCRVGEEVAASLVVDVVVVAAQERRHHRADARRVIAKRLVGQDRRELHRARPVLRGAIAPCAQLDRLVVEFGREVALLLDLDALKEVQTEISKQLLRLDVELEQLAGDQHQPRADLDRRVMALEKPERARRRGERDGCEQKR